jgi:hypothetical protein
MRKCLEPSTELALLGFRTKAFPKTGRKVLATVGLRTAITFYNRSRRQICSGRRDKLSIFAGFSRDGPSKFAFEQASGLVVPAPRLAHTDSPQGQKSAHRRR